MTAVPESFTDDSLFGGRLSCRQHRLGYRFSIDAVLLAHFLKVEPAARLLDLGAGCGVVALIMAFRHPGLAITALELQDSLFGLLEQNISMNNFTRRIRAVHGDLRQISELCPAGGFDLVLANPPYYATGSGRQCGHAEQALARHELMAALADVVAATRFALRVGGRAAFVYPAGRLARLLSGLVGQGLAPKRLRMVHGYPGGPARLALVEARKGGGEELTVQEPLYIYTAKHGTYGDEVAAMYAADPSPPRRQA